MKCSGGKPNKTGMDNLVDCHRGTISQVLRQAKMEMVSWNPWPTTERHGRRCCADDDDDDDDDDGNDDENEDENDGGGGGDEDGDDDDGDDEYDDDDDDNDYDEIMMMKKMIKYYSQCNEYFESRWSYH